MTVSLVTGGSGYFGMLMVRRLLAAGHTVRVLDLNDADDRPTNVEFVQGDIRDAAIVAEAGGSIAGGHTIRNPEPVFGLAVQGLVHPDRVLRKGGSRPRDALVLSKPLGTGLVLAGGVVAVDVIVMRNRPKEATV